MKNIDNPVLNLQEKETKDNKSTLLRKSSKSTSCGNGHHIIIVYFANQFYF